MGLDMYLYRRSYVCNSEWMPAEQRELTTVAVNGGPHPSIKSERIKYVIEQVAYWRKANAIHQWFVDHVQEGRDECQESVVTAKQLRELIATCKQALDAAETIPGELNAGQTFYADGTLEIHTVPGSVATNPKMLKDILPTKSGFFFGSTDYDEHYLQDLKNTIEQLEPLLAEDHDEHQYCYRASW